MPLLHVHVPAGSIDAGARRPLGEAMAAALLRIERVAETPAARAMSWVFWHEVPDGAWIVPGDVDGSAPARCLVEVVAPQGILDAEQKAATIAELTNLVLAAWHAEDDLMARLRIWVVIRDVPDGDWGVAGYVAKSSVIMSGLGAK